MIPNLSTPRLILCWLSFITRTHLNGCYGNQLDRIDKVRTFSFSENFCTSYKVSRLLSVLYPKIFLIVFYFQPSTFHFRYVYASYLTNLPADMFTRLSNVRYLWVLYSPCVYMYWQGPHGPVINKLITTTTTTTGTVVKPSLKNEFAPFHFYRVSRGPPRFVRILAISLSSLRSFFFLVIFSLALYYLNPCCRDKLDVGDFSWSWICKDTIQHQKEKENSSSLFTARGRIRRFHVKVVRWTWKKFNKCVIHVQSCCFAHKTNCFLTFSLSSASSLTVLCLLRDWNAII